MNKYALIAQEHWKTYAPSRYANLTDPETVFQTLGESAASQIHQIASAMEAQLDQNLPYLSMVGQMNAIRRQAEEIMLSDLVYSVESEQTSLAEELDQMLGDLPEPRSIRAMIDQIREVAEREAELDHLPPSSLSEMQELQISQLTALLPLVTLEQDVYEMSEAAIRDRILALRPFWDPETRSLVTL